MGCVSMWPSTCEVGGHQREPTAGHPPPPGGAAGPEHLLSCRATRLGSGCGRAADRTLLCAEHGPPGAVASPPPYGPEWPRGARGLGAGERPGQAWQLRSQVDGWALGHLALTAGQRHVQPAWPRGGLSRVQLPLKAPGQAGTFSSVRTKARAWRGKAAGLTLRPQPLSPDDLPTRAPDLRHPPIVL